MMSLLANSKRSRKEAASAKIELDAPHAVSEVAKGECNVTLAKV